MSPGTLCAPVGVTNPALASASPPTVGRDVSRAGGVGRAERTTGTGGFATGQGTTGAAVADTARLSTIGSRIPTARDGLPAAGDATAKGSASTALVSTATARQQLMPIDVNSIRASLH
jgi:hypothetical protein